MTERKTFLRGILGTGGLGGCPRRRLGSAVPEYYTVLLQLKDFAHSYGSYIHWWTKRDRIVNKAICSTKELAAPSDELETWKETVLY